jgi:hypothetical protein
MNRKEELAILIVAAQEKYDNFWENVNKLAKELNEKASALFTKFALENGEDVDGKLETKIFDGSVEVFLRGCTWDSVIKLYNRMRFNSDNKKQLIWELNYGTSGLDWNAKEINFIKLKLFGLIAREMGLHKTGKSELFAELENLLEEQKEFLKGQNPVKWDLENLKTELKNLEYNEVVDAAFEKDELKLEAAINLYIRPADSRSCKVAKIIYNKITDKAITITYIGVHGGIIDTYRQEAGEARRRVYDMVKAAKEAYTKLEKDTQAKRVL